MKQSFLIYIIAVLICSTGCKKYLEATPDKSLVVPNSLVDLQAMLDFTDYMSNRYPAAGAVQSDDYFLPNDFVSYLTPYDLAMYTWQKTEQTDEVYIPIYQAGIYYANIVLDYVDEVPKGAGEEELYRWVKGSGYFFRAFYMHAAAQLFAKPYNRSTASTEEGIIMRLSSAFSDKSIRSTLEQNYQQIVSDLQKAEELLPIRIDPKTRPSKLAAYGVLAKVYLSMGKYDSAGYYANRYLSEQGTLIDYNTIDATLPAPFPLFNEEVSFNAQSSSNIALVFSVIDSVLYKSYEENDLRKLLFFENSGGNILFKGNYVGNPAYYGQVFAGVATDEMYLIRAESQARDSNLASSVNDLNTLLEKRYKSGTFSGVKASTAFDALKLVLTERRKELPFRDTRWTDLRRLNNEPAFRQSLVRKVNNQEFKLEPNSNRYALLLPVTVIQRSGVRQND